MSADDPASWAEWLDKVLTDTAASGRWRRLRSFDALGPEGVLDGRRVVSFASNDYLGLSTHPGVTAAAHAAIDRWGTGATASRHIVGSRPVHHELEEELAAWKRTESAVVFTSGYTANLGVISTLAGPGVSVLSDELNHASIIDGCRLARAAVSVYRHNDLSDLARQLDTRPDGRCLVVTDSVFSMDGDVVDVDALVELCARHGAMAVLDEAHCVLGPDLADRPGPHVVRVGTLSKTLGSAGGFVAASTAVGELLVNRSRSLIFTTGLSPVDAAAGLAALEVVRSSEGEALRDRLRRVIERVRPGHPSPIVPVVLGDEETALKAAALLLDRGLFVPAIRPPTVPVGTSRLRVALSAAHTDDMVDRLLEALHCVGGR